MAWVSWNRKSPTEANRENAILGVDLNAARVPALQWDEPVELGSSCSKIPISICLWHSIWRIAHRLWDTPVCGFAGNFHICHAPAIYPFWATPANGRADDIDWIRRLLSLMFLKDSARLPVHLNLFPWHCRPI